MLEWTTAKFKGPGVCDLTLAEPKLGISAAAEKKLVGDPYHQDIAVLAVPDKPVVSPDDIVDLTSKMDADGHVRWQAPQGNWKIFRFAQVATRQGNPSSLQIDGLSGAAMDKAWQGTMKVLLDEMTPDERRGLKFIEEDSWEAGEPNWTQTFADEFKKRRGYDLVPLLPALAGQTVGSEDAVRQIKADYKLTINDLFAENHYGYRRKLADANGLPFFVEGAGPNMKESDLLRNISEVDVGMAEFWMPSPHRPTPERRFLLRDAATANHIYGKPVTPCEAFTSVGPHWEESLFDMKACADQAFCDGMNRIVFHNFGQSASMTAKPGYTMWAGTHYEPGVTWWDQTPAFNDYLSRCSSLLQQGLFAADALMYVGDPFGYGGHAMKKVLPTLGEGYDSDDCNSDALLTRAAAKDGRVVFPDGMSYRVLVLPDGQPMRSDVLHKVLDLLNGGATVVGPKPTGMADFSADANAAKAFSELADRLWTGGAAGDQHVGAGRLVWGKTAREVLQGEDVKPDVEYSGLSKNGTLDWIHRTAGDADVYYVASRWFTPENVNCTFRVAGKQPELWDPVTGRNRVAAAFHQADGRTTVPLTFGPCGSTFVIFRKTIDAKTQGTAASNQPAIKLLQQLNGPWQVAFDPKWGGPAEVRFDTLVDWTSRPEPGIRFYSGTATYKKTFDLPAVPASGSVVLDLGEVHEVAHVRLNGHDLGTVWNHPATVDITSALQAGENKLEVDVVDLWPNRLIGDASLPPDQRHTVTNMRKFTPKTPLLPSGLIWPVQLKKEEFRHE
ncbi:MAG: glycosyl hydrolase [Tepidisphaeraceae bacterium]